jgi:hypothetical protein
MSSRRWVPVALGGLAVGVLLAPTMAASAHPTTQRLKAPAARSAGVVTYRVPRAEQAATRAYWTPARMRNAKPLDIVVRKSAPTGRAIAPAATGKPGAVAPVTPTGKRVNTSLDASGASGPSALAFSYPFPFTRFNVFPTSLYNSSPRQVNGKVFFTQNGGNFVCSGTSVTATNRNEVWLAGHCVNNGAGVFDSFAEFVPSYNGNASNVAPKGVFVATRFATSSSWNSSGDFSRDLGAMTVGTNSDGVLVQNKVGGAGFAWNQSRDQQFVDFGYPQASPFNGNSMVTCLGATAVADTGVGGSGPAPIGIGCDMTGGSSGGSWQIKWGGSGGNIPGYINGHNDYKYGSQPLAMYSPYFDNTANAVRCILEVSGSNGC